jgi:hypothetical protein
MSGAEATDDLDEAHHTQVWPAASDQPEALVTGEYLYHLRKKGTLPAARDVAKQDRLLADLRAPQRYRSARVASLIRILW